MKKTFTTILAIAVGLATWTAPATAGDTDHPVEVTSGHFQALQSGSQIAGRAIMLRSDHDGGHTVVWVHLRGLDADASYPTHVHNRPCSATPPGGSHYQNVLGGSVDSVNEIWPTVVTKANGVGFGYAVHEARARADARSIVVHNPADTSIRLACVDLT